MKAKRQIRFTVAELDVIISMYCIAHAGDGEGDYADWTEADWETSESLLVKVSELRRRLLGEK